jgi:hypothetical protein
MLMIAVCGKSRLLSTGFCTGACRMRRVAEGGLHLYGEVDALDHQVKLSHKYVLSFEARSLLNLVIFKLKCNNLILSEI